MTDASGELLPDKDLSGFREALFAQYRKRYLSLKRAVDDDIADMIAVRRLEVEKIVHDLHRTCEERLRDGLSANRNRAELRIKASRSAAQDELMQLLEQAVRVRLDGFRRTEEYGRAMKALAAEAGEGLALPAVALVEKGDASFLSRCDGIVEVREELEGVWGGLVLAEAGKGGGRLVDNTFRTRWRRLYPSFLELLRERMEEVFGGAVPVP